MCIGFFDRTCLCLSINSSAGSHLNRINVIAPSGVPCRGICLPIVLWLHRMRKDRQTQLYIDYMMPEWREFWQSLVHPSPVPCNLQESVLQSFFFQNILVFTQSQFVLGVLHLKFHPCSCGFISTCSCFCSVTMQK